MTWVCLRNQEIDDRDDKESVTSNKPSSTLTPLSKLWLCGTESSGFTSNEAHGDKNRRVKGKSSNEWRAEEVCDWQGERQTERERLRWTPVGHEGNLKNWEFSDPKDGPGPTRLKPQISRFKGPTDGLLGPEVSGVSSGTRRRYVCREDGGREGDSFWFF